MNLYEISKSLLNIYSHKYFNISNEFTKYSSSPEVKEVYRLYVANEGEWEFLTIEDLERFVQDLTIARQYNDLGMEIKNGRFVL